LPATPIRVCYLIDNLAVGGTEKQLLALIAQLDRSCVMPYLCLLDGQGEVSRCLEPANCAVVRLGVRSLRSARAVTAGWRFVQFLRRERIDIVQLHFRDSTYFGAPLARLAGVRCVIRTQRNQGHWMTPWDRRLGRIMGRLATATIANSDACRQVLISGEGARPESVHVVPNGIDLTRFENIRPLGGWCPAGWPRRVGVVANLRPVKNLELFVRAASLLAPRFPDVEFVVAGEGECRLQLERLIVELGMTSRVKLLGAVNDVPGFLSSLEVAVLCSKAEGMPNSVLEYMAAGKAIVATAVGGTPELVEHERQALLVPPGDIDALARAMLRLLRDRTFAAQLAAAARRQAQRYGVDAMTRRYEQFSLDLVRQSPAYRRRHRRNLANRPPSQFSPFR
jgi:glycosyltransferase involved in cell wall biosynthesis